MQNLKEDTLYKLYIKMQQETDRDVILHTANKIKNILSPGQYDEDKHVFTFAQGTQVAMQQVLYENTCMEMNDVNARRGFIQTVTRNRLRNDYLIPVFTDYSWSWGYSHYDLPMTFALNLYGHYSEKLYKHYYGDHVQPPFRDISEEEDGIF